MKSAEYERADHQPHRGPVNRPLPSHEELKRACGKTAAVVLATDFGTTPLVVQFEDEKRESATCGANDAGKPTGTPRPLQAFEGKAVTSIAVEVALACGFASVSVLAGGSDDERAALERAVNEEVPPSRGIVRFIPFDADAAYRATVRAHGFSLYDIPKGVLDYAKRALDKAPQAESVLLLSCDQVRITPAHIYEVCRTFRDGPALDAVASWIQWYRRTPLVVSRAFLDGLDASGLCELRPGGCDRPLPCLRMKDIVFGEEKLAANAIVPATREAFRREHTLSAREAVAIAHSELDDVGANIDTHAGKEKPRAPKRPAADEELIDVARSVVSRMSAWMSELPQAKARAIRSADAWAWRNREDFPLLNDRAQKNTLAYLDSAATTQRCFRALKAEATFYEHENANVYRGGYELSAHATAYLNDARKVLEDFTGAERRQTVYTINASAACNLVAHSWGDFNVGAGDTIVVALSEHHSNLLPWLLLAKRTGASLEYVPVLPDGRLDLTTYDALLAKRPKLVCAAHVSNTMGIINPVRNMIGRAHEVGARFMLDAAQSLPHVPFNVKDLGCDFAAFSAHKMYGPFGIGGLYIAPEAFAEMDPSSIGGGTISHASIDSYYLREGAIQYEVGTPPIAQAIGWAGAIEYLNGLQMERVLAHAEAMTDYATFALHGVEGLTIWGDHTEPDGAGGLLAFSLPNVTPPEIGADCGMLGVAVRSGGHCAMPVAASIGVVGTGRASFAVHTTCEDIEALAVALEMSRRLHR